jgi:hypothetical protein
MEESSKNNSSKVIIIVLLILLLGSVFYNIKLLNTKTSMETVVQNTKTEKEKVLDDLNALKLTYDTAISEKTSMSNELIAERNKITELIAEVKKSKGNVASLAKYKKMYFEMEDKMKTMVVEFENVKKENTKLTVQRDSIQVVTTEAKKVNEELIAQNSNLNKTVEKASKLFITDLKSSAYKQKSSGKKIDTEKASKADILKISFTISENIVAQPGERTYDVQIIDSNNNVIGEKKTESYGMDQLTYSFKKTLLYENKPVVVTEELPVQEIPSGTYFVNVFDKGELVSKTSFALR